MRVLTGNLEANQKLVGLGLVHREPIWKIVLSRAGQSTQTYTQTRVLSITHTEEEDNQEATVLLDNHDNALTTIDFERYKGIISYGYNDPTNGNEFSPTAPLRIRGQRLLSAQGIRMCQLTLEGIPNLLGIDLAESELTLTDGDVRTVKTLISAIANASLSPYTNYTNYTTTYDSEDTLIDSFVPKEIFRVGLNSNRLSKIKELLGWTGSKMRTEDDEALHFFDPVISGTSYDYEYSFNVSGEHTFFNKELRNRFVNPNKEVVKSHPTHDPQFSASATSATSFALFPQTHTTLLRLASDAEASNVASALIERYELDAERGAVKVPMNAGQEVWDWIKVTDSRQNDSRTGNVRYLRRNIQVPALGGRFVFDMDVRFGKSAVLPSPILSLSQAGGAGAGEPVSIAALIEAFNILQQNFNALSQDLNTTVEGVNNLITFINTQIDEAIFRRLTVIEELIIPFEG